MYFHDQCKLEKSRKGHNSAFVKCYALFKNAILQQSEVTQGDIF